MRKAYRRLQEDFWLDAGKKSRRPSEKTVRWWRTCCGLLHLPEAIRTALIEGKISAGHGRALVAIEDEAIREALFQRRIVFPKNLPVRHSRKKPFERISSRRRSPSICAPMAMTIGRPKFVRLKKICSGHSPEKWNSIPQERLHKKGWIRLEFYSLDDLDALIAQLKKTICPQ